MAKNVIIVPADGDLQFKDLNDVLSARFQLDDSNNLLISNAQGDLIIGTSSTDVIFGNVPNSSVDTDRFLVSDGGFLKYRTGSQLRSDIGAQAAGTYDNYVNWKLNSDGTFRSNIASGNTVNFVGGSNVSISYSATNNTLTFASTDTNTTYTAGTGLSLTGTTFALSHLGIQSLTDPNADRIAFWDDSAGAFAWLTAGSNLTISGTTLNATNTTYSQATLDTLGLVKLGSSTTQTVAANGVTETAGRSYAVQLNASGQMLVNVPWTDNNTTYSGSTSIVLSSGSFQRAALTGDVTAAQNNNTTTIASGAVTLAKMANLAANSIIGNNTGSAAVPKALTVAEVKTMLGAGSVNGLATLDAGGKVPTDQLPSYVDDVIEAANFAGLPVTGETGKIYVTLDNGNIYRWSGSAYVQINDAVSSADQAATLATARNITITGDASWTVSFNGSQDVSANLTIASAAVEAGMLNNNIISGLTALTSGLASSDELMISDAGTIKRMDVSVLQSYMQSNLSFSNNAGTVTSVGGTGTVNGITLTGTVTSSGNLTLGGTLSGITVAQLAGSAVITSAESFADSDTALLTAAAVDDRILSYGYTTNVGDITAVTAGNGLTGGGSSGAVTLNIGAGSGITVGADDISVDSTVVRTTGSQSIAGTKTFTDTLTIENATSGATLLDIQGTNGQLFSIVDSLTGSLFSVNDISGIPIFEVFSDETVKIGTFNSEAIIVEGNQVKFSQAATDNTATTGLFLNGSNQLVKRVLGSGAFGTINDAVITISAGTGLSSGGDFTTNQSSNETITLNLDLNELSTSTTNADGDFFVVVDTSGNQRKLTKANINLSEFNNNSGWTSNAGTVTSVGGTGTVNGITLTGTVTSSGNLTLGGSLSGITVAQLAGSAVITSAESFADSDTALLTAAAVDDRILSYGYTTNVGDITSVTAGTGLSGGGTSGDVTLTNSDRGSSQNIFKNIAVSGQSTIVADSNDDTLTFVAGSNVTITTNATNDSITITSTDTNTTYSAGTGLSLTGTTFALSHLGLQDLSDPNGDRIAFWDDSAGEFAWLTAGSNLSISGTTINATNTTYSQATLDTLGLVKLGSSTVQTVAGNTVTATAGRSYAVQVNASGQMLVNVPWTDTDTDTTYSAGTGLSLTGTTFANTDRGSSQNIFKNIAVSGQSTVVADSNNDTLTLVAGSNVTITTDATNDTITISSTDTNTTYSGSTSIVLSSGSFQRAALTGDVTAAQNANSTTIASNVVTNTKLADMAVNTIKGRVTAGTGDPEDLTAAQVRTILGAGSANGLATLGSDGKVPTSQLPSYVDDVVEFVDYATMIASSGETGKIYVTLDNGNIYRWSGSAYVQINDAVTSADQAASISTARSITVTGDASWTVSFDGSSDVSANLTIASGAVEASMLNNNIISGLTALTSGLASTDELVVSDAGTIKRMDVSVLQSYMQSNLAFSNNAGTVTSVGGTGTVNGITLTGTVTSSGNLTLGGSLSGITVAQLAGSAVITSAEAFSDSDTALLTAAAVDDRILSYGYTTNVGDITAVTAGTGLSGGGTSGSVTLTNSDPGSSQNIFKTILNFDGSIEIAASSNNDSFKIVGDGATEVALDSATKTITVTSSDTNTTYSAGTGLSLTGTTFALSHLGIQSLTDPNADRIAFWDDSAGAFAWLTVGSNLSISGTTITATNTTYSQATLDTLGLVKLGSSTAQTVAANTVTSTAGRSYAVQVNASGQMLVNVPWTDTDTNTTYSAGTGLSLSGTTFNNIDTGSAQSIFKNIENFDGSSRITATTNNDTFKIVGAGATEVTLDPATNTILVASNDTNTTYSAGTGLSLAGTTFALSHLGIQSLTDPNADRIAFWDDSAGAFAWLTVSTGLTLSGTTLTNSDRGSSQAIFKNFAVSGQSTVSAESNNDTLTLVAGSNISITTNASTDTITIAATTHDAVTIGTANGLSLSTQVLSLAAASASSAGAVTTGTQTFAGAKTFSSSVSISANSGQLSFTGNGQKTISTALNDLVIDLNSTEDICAVIIDDTAAEAKLHVKGDYNANGISIYATHDIVAFSDSSVKTNIRNIDSALNRVVNSRGVIYDRIDTDAKDNIGFIAQELEQQFPELVYTQSDGKKAVKYQNAVAVLFEAIKEQQKQIEDIKKLLDK